MFRTLGWKALAGATLLVLFPTTFAVAGFTARTSNSSTIQSIGPTGTWGICAGLTAGAACGGSYTTPTIATPCPAPVTQTVFANGTGTTVQLTSTTGLIAGMIPTGTGIAASPIWLASISTPNVTLSKTGNTFTNLNTITFSTCTGKTAFLYLNNKGTAKISTINLTDSASLGGGNTLDLQSCNSGGAGTTALAWDTTNDLCVGQINTIASLTSANSPLPTSSYPMPIAGGGSVQLRAVSSQNNKALTVSASITQSNLTSASTNG